MAITKGQKITAKFNVYQGVKTREKYSWICSCGRIFSSKASASKCDNSNHRNVDTETLLNIKGIHVSKLTLNEQNVLGYLKCAYANKNGFDCIYNVKFYDKNKIEHR